MVDDMFCVEKVALEHMGNLVLWVEQEDLENMSSYICVERETMENMSFETFVLNRKLWNTWKGKLEVLGIIPTAFHVGVKHKLWNIRSLAIVSLVVSYKYILALVLSEEL